MLRLYERAIALPIVETDGSELLDRISTEEWGAIRNGINNRLARDQYWEIFEPLEPGPAEPTVGSISDDLADIWRDVKPGLAAMDAGKRAEAAWEWRFSLETHWSRHAAGAIAALSALCYWEFADPDRPPAKVRA